MKILYIVLFLGGQLSFGQVGINTDNPQQALHLAGNTGTLRIESLNADNPNNGGGNKKYPLYVDENGDFTLKLKTAIGSEDTDAFMDIPLSQRSVTLLADDTDGKATTLIKTYTITTTRPTILAVTYGLSFDVYLNSHNPNPRITDNLARRVQNYITVNERTRKYASASKAFTSGSTKSVTGNFYNTSTAYIKLDNPGIGPHSYLIKFWGLVDSGVRDGNSGTVSQSTYVEFATGNDFLFMRLY